MSGIHHVTAISGAAARNLDFYTRTLGLRLVKKTVNFDDPGTYHLYYGDEQGQPGTILDLLPVGACRARDASASARPRRPRSACRPLDRLLDASPDREGRAARGAGEALRRDGARRSRIRTA